MLFTFLARQMARPNHGIVVDRSLFDQVLESLCSGGDTAPLASRPSGDAVGGDRLDGVGGERVGGAGEQQGRLVWPWGW